ncbi:MAG: sigma-70 family RNA polymerase sigma factor [Cyanobacteria bacterium Co-bin13]|nr:sigma-70 family RNA polymerase sigma factor [Cyanobacteria bacterium Co-bin13]
MPPDPSTPDPANLRQATDQSLVTRLRAGQTDALGVLYDRYARLVYSLALRMLGNLEEAEDLTQEVFLAFWQRDKYDVDRGSLSSFLVTFTRSRALDRLRNRGVRYRAMERLQGLTQPSSKAETPLERASLEERSQQTREALNQLPALERQVLEIAYFENLSQSQIAQKLNIPLGTVKTRCRQGLLRLRQLLTDHR